MESLMRGDPTNPGEVVLDPETFQGTLIDNPKSRVCIACNYQVPRRILKLPWSKKVCVITIQGNYSPDRKQITLRPCRSLQRLSYAFAHEYKHHQDLAEFTWVGHTARWALPWVVALFAENLVLKLGSGQGFNWLTLLLGMLVFATVWKSYYYWDPIEIRANIYARRNWPKFQEILRNIVDQPDQRS